LKYIKRCRLNHGVYEGKWDFVVFFQNEKIWHLTNKLLAIHITVREQETVKE
jgi:hypothetical protein